MLDYAMTRGANQAGESIDDVVNDITTWLAARGFADISVPPVPNYPGDGEPVPN
jgi:hypothetical protein